MPTISTLTVLVDAKTSNFSKGLKIASAGLAALAVGAAYAFKQFEEGEKVANTTAAVLKSTGHAANVTADQVSSLAYALGEKSGIDDEVIQSGENMLLTFRNIHNEVGAGNDIFNQASTAALDMAAGMAAASGGTVNLKSATIQLGKAMNDPIGQIGALSRAGVLFTEQQKAQMEAMVKSGDLLGAQKIILGELTKEFGGDAEANATATGHMSFAFQNLAQAVGTVLAPAITFLLAGLTAFVAYLQANVGPAVEQIRTWFAGVMVTIGPFVTLIKDAAVDAFKKMWESIKPLIPELKKLWTSIQPVLKVIGMLIGAMLYVGLKVLPIVFDQLANMIKIMIQVGTVAANIVSGIIKGFQKFVDFFRHLPSNLKAIGSHMWDWLVQTFRSAINGIIGIWNNLRFPGFTHTFDPLGQFGPAQTVSIPAFDLPNIPTLRTGGLVAKTGLALVHEGERFSGVGGFGSVNVYVSGSVIAEHDLAEAVQKVLLRSKRRSGALGLA